ncbi:DUF4139 domain-containing protein [Nitratifractor salsuginis]|uniref:DUF4139 domain-containing protein n=1 Tax=Nitratifractor salsuginis (strain DSM 16511 / JCM 12458 / E9I37-1) TaxID=749222 RepID=E6X0U8_NITSE|nr:hypothetical protein [Nitratifractor salsuginis]ADV46880.1 hypothetical protein Nitsa_1632 [Nitratifractor salsuginis DSM 16511]
MKAFIPIFTLTLGTLMAASTVIPPSDSNLSLTIYTNDRAFIHEKRQVSVPAGDQRLVYQNVPNTVIPSSVIPEFSGIPVTLYSQNYVYDLISLTSMLQKSIGQKVLYRPDPKSRDLKEGLLLSAAPSVMIRTESKGRIVTLKDPSQVVFPTIPPTMITRPSLVWHIQTPKAGPLDVDLKYLSRGLSWRSDYVLNLHPKKHTFDLVGWITVDNRTGVSYPHAKIYCLAGEVHTEEKRPMPRAIYKTMAMAAPNVKEESFAGYHLYTIPFRETIRAKEKKQIRFLEKAGITYRQFARAKVHSFQRSGELRLSFLNTLTFRNSASNGLGLPLPRGIVRMYSPDASGTFRFIGESRLGNTPADERVNLSIGTLFDVTGTKKTLKYIARDNYRNVVSQYTLHNRGDVPRVLKIEEQIPTYGGTIRLKSSCSGPCSVRKLTAFVREFTVRLKPKESYKFTSEFEVIR